MTQIEKTENGYLIQGSPKMSHALAMGILLAGSLIFTIGCLLGFRGLIADGQEGYIWLAVSIVPIALGALLAYTGYRNSSIDMKIDKGMARVEFIYLSNGKPRREEYIALSKIKSVVTQDSDGGDILRDNADAAADSGHNEHVIVQLKSGRRYAFPAKYPQSSEIQKILVENIDRNPPPAQPSAVRSGGFGRGNIRAKSFGRAG